MKRTFFSIGLIGFVLIMGSVLGCSGGGPSAAFEQAHTAMEKGNTKALIAMLEPGSAELFAGFVKEYEAEFKEEMRKQTAKTGGISRIEETINGDTATLTVNYRDGSIQNQKMVKVGRKWKMTMGK